MPFFYGDACHSLGDIFGTTPLNYPDCSFRADDPNEQPLELPYSRLLGEAYHLPLYNLGNLAILRTDAVLFSVYCQLFASSFLGIVFCFLVESAYIFPVCSSLIFAL